MITGEIKSQVDKVWLAFHTGGITNPISAIEQFTYLVFLRRLDEEQLKEEKKANLVGIPMTKTIFTPEQRHLGWNSFKNKNSEEIFELFTKTSEENPSVFEHMKTVEIGVFANS